MLQRDRLTALFLMGCAMAAPAAAQAQAAQGPAAQGQTPPPVQAFPATRAFPGYTHPLITSCQTTGPARRECTVPGNIAGHYVIEAVGLFTATGPNPAVGMNIVVGNQVCMQQGGSKFTGRVPLHLLCEVTFATDAPIKVVVNLAANDAALEPAGPVLQIDNEPWDGVISMRGSAGGPVQVNGPPAPTAPATPAKPAARPGNKPSSSH